MPRATVHARVCVSSIIVAVRVNIFEVHSCFGQSIFRGYGICACIWDMCVHMCMLARVESPQKLTA